MNTPAEIGGARHVAPGLDQVIKLAILAVGGQGGGVLTNWLIGVAEREGYAVQATSVAGVAQRTGATIYYLEMLPEAEARPVFALAPAEGDVDILVAAEWMEAGRAILRGFVTPDRTTLIASTHRSLATAEKIVPGTALADPGEVRKAADRMARRVVAFDMERIAQEAGSVISASLLGALAGSGCLPFAAESYRETIRASGRGVAPSLAAFDAARRVAEEGAEPSAPASVQGAEAVVGPADLRRGWDALAARVEAFPAPVAEMAGAGLRRVVDYQDLAYGRQYLDRVEAALAVDQAAEGYAFATAAAKAIARAMCYDDILRVADLKTRGARMPRIRAEMGAGAGQVMHVTEFVHPGAAEIVSILPAGLGRWISVRPGAMRLVDRLVNRGRRLRTDAVWPFVQLYLLAGLRRHRRRLLRHGTEVAHLERLTDLAMGAVGGNYALGVALWEVQRLVKGYSDTHARGLSKLDRVLAGTALVQERADAADWVRRLIAAALADPEGEALDGALETIRSFV